MSARQVPLGRCGLVCAIGAALLAANLGVLRWLLRAQPAQWDPQRGPGAGDDGMQNWGDRDPSTEILPFHIHVDQRRVDDMEARLRNARVLRHDAEDAAGEPARPPWGSRGWPRSFDETKLAYIVDTWRDHFDWREYEAELNANYPSHTTVIAGLRIHFVMMAPDSECLGDAPRVPLLLLHGWPGAFLEFVEGGVARRLNDACHPVIIPSMPGYGFSDAPSRPGVGAVEVASLYKGLMERLGFSQYVVQGGDWGGLIASFMGQIDEEHCVGVHVNWLPLLPPIAHGSPFRMFEWFLPDDDRERMIPNAELPAFVWRTTGYMHIHQTRPASLGAAVAASPVALAAWNGEKFYEWSDAPPPSRAVSAILSLYWLTDSGGSAVDLYAHTLSSAQFFGLLHAQVRVPLAYIDFAREITPALETWLPLKATDVRHFTRVDHGGHFAALECPQELADDVLAFVRGLGA